RHELLLNTEAGSRIATGNDQEIKILLDYWHPIVLGRTFHNHVVPTMGEQLNAWGNAPETRDPRAGGNRPVIFLVRVRLSTRRALGPALWRIQGRNKQTINNRLNQNIARTR
ncbi:hypothetical protein T310_9078, partial [Rasamsonia emersonii CBS 393.64]